jgi:AhpD family alkylhydroperoxidase
MFMLDMLPLYPQGYRRVMSQSHGKVVLDDLAPLSRDLRKAIPDVYKGFHELHHAAFAPGALDTRTKELIALAIGVSEECDGCIASHARGAAVAGATKEEAAEAIGVTFLMNGGPATIYGPRAYAAFCEFWDAAHPLEIPVAATV